MGAVAGDDERARDLMARARQLRRDAGIPIGAMAERCGCATSTMSRWEKAPLAGTGRRDRRTWLAVLAVLDATSGGPGASPGTSPRAPGGETAGGDGGGG